MLGYETNRFIRMVFSALLAGAMAAGSNLLTGINADGNISQGTLTVALISGGILAIKDLVAFLAVPPEQTTQTMTVTTPGRVTESTTTTTTTPQEP